MRSSCAGPSRGSNAATAARAALLSEEGRLKTPDRRLGGRRGALARQRIGILEAEAKDLRWDLNEAWANDGAAALALHAATELAQRRWLEAAVLERDQQRLEQQVDQDRGQPGGARNPAARCHYPER